MGVGQPMGGAERQPILRCAARARGRFIRLGNSSVRGGKNAPVRLPRRGGGLTVGGEACHRDVSGRLEDFHSIDGGVETSISALFLLVISIANLFILKGIPADFTCARRSERISEDLDALRARRGLIARIFRPLFCIVPRS
ncbi:hypothetical protein [Mesorhizobium sp. YC-39]|uniref:HoxN/HupN/NixA family nickel/cobalt transporter n=2 Tax=unclassified Mesorhizobium TaxID=325217 RepID=UPI0029816510|nr:hypothetical protein [Mesorhizobium sp. YC-39]